MSTKIRKVGLAFLSIRITLYPAILISVNGRPTSMRKKKPQPHPVTTSSIPPQAPSKPPAPDSDAPTEYIVDPILPKHEIHLVGGPSHAGKTTLVMQTIAAWSKGKDVFGHESHPAPYCYLACECTGVTVRSTLNRLEIPPEDFTFASLIDETESTEFDAALQVARRTKPDLEVLFIDGIHRLCNGKSNDDHAVGNFLATINRRLVTDNLTIIGIGNSTKVKGDDHFLNPRERFRGSGAWGTGTRTMIIVERARTDDLRNLARVVMIIPSNAPDQVLNYTLNARGIFTPNIEELDRYEEFMSMIVCREPGEELTRAELLEIASYIGDGGLPDRTMARYVDRMIEETRLERAQWGRYRLPLRH